jgi:two-component system NtrC family response regulator
MASIRILVVDDDDSLRRVMEVRLQQEGYTVSVAASGEEALDLLSEEPIDLVLSDVRMPALSGLDLLKAIHTQQPETIVILMTAYATIESAVEAVKAGAYDYITKPVGVDELRLLLSRALEHRSLRQEVYLLRSSLNSRFGFESIIGKSPALMKVLDTAIRAARSSATVLIQGETGTGKELLAKAIHFNSERKEMPFIAINCGAIPKDLIESELFGHVKGSFTGAITHKIGRVEMADGGTLFLDEVGDMSPELQVKLLRLIQSGATEKIGATAPTTVDVRIVAATHQPLLELTKSGGFREDLYYRLSVIPLTLPPLRNRREDIGELVTFFLEKNKAKHCRPQLTLPDSIRRYFLSYPWPGNVRELENTMERLVVLARGDQITYEDLPQTLRKAQPGLGEVPFNLPSDGVDLTELEKNVLIQALIRNDWNQTRTARFLNLSRKTLLYRMGKFGITRQKFSNDPLPPE